MVITEIVVLVMSVVSAVIQVGLVYVDDDPLTAATKLVSGCIVFFLFYPLFTHWRWHPQEKSHKFSTYFAINAGTIGIIYGVPMLIYMIIRLIHRALLHEGTQGETSIDWMGYGMITLSVMAWLPYIFNAEDLIGLVSIGGIIVAIIFAVRAENERLESLQVSPHITTVAERRSLKEGLDDLWSFLWLLTCFILKWALLLGFIALVIKGIISFTGWLMS